MLRAGWQESYLLTKIAYGFATCSDNNTELLHQIVYFSEKSKVSAIVLFQFFLNRAELSMKSANSENLRNHGCMNWIYLYDSLCYLCLLGAEVECFFLTQEIAVLNPPFTKILVKFCRLCRFFRIDLGKTRLCLQVPLKTFSDLVFFFCC